MVCGWPVDPTSVKSFVATAVLKGVSLDVGEGEFCVIVGAPGHKNMFEAPIAAVGEAIAAGVDGRGYMLWSLFDNLEWSLGYSKRFGMVHVDFESQERTPKDSAKLYSRIIASNGASIE